MIPSQFHRENTTVRENNLNHMFYKKNSVNEDYKSQLPQTPHNQFKSFNFISEDNKMKLKGNITPIKNSSESKSFIYSGMKLDTSNISVKSIEKEKKLLVLDLDETLVHGETESSEFDDFKKEVKLKR